jgi:hypothetical protein
LLGGFAGSQIENLLERFDGRPGEMVERVTKMGPALLAWFVGAVQSDTSPLLPERPWLLWISGACVLSAAGRLVQLTARRAGAWRPRAFARQLGAQVAGAPFAWYMLVIGVVALATFMAGKPVLDGYSRYAILGLLIPVGLTAALLALEPLRVARRGVTILVVAWAGLAVVDHVSVLAANIRQPAARPLRELADRLVERQVAVASAGYWEAYAVTFLAQERVRVRVTPSDVVRIQEYQDLFAERFSEALVVEHQPCPGGERVARWYLCRP